MSSLAAIDSYSFSFSFFGDIDEPIEHYFPFAPAVSTFTASFDQAKESSSSAPSKSPQKVSLPVPPEQAPPSTLPKSRSPRREAARPRSPSPRHTQVPSKRSRSPSPRHTVRKARQFVSVQGDGSPLLAQGAVRERSRSRARSAQPATSPGAARPQPPSPGPPRYPSSKHLLRQERGPARRLPPPKVDSNEPPLTNAELFPSLKGLGMNHYGPFLTRERIELTWSSTYWHAIMQFLNRAAPVEKWRSNPKSTYQPRDLFPIMETLQGTQPDKAAIREAVGRLGSATGHRGLPEHLHLRIRALRDVMRWIWDDTKKEIMLEQASWLVAEASRNRALLPIYILFREHSSTLRFSDAVEVSQRELLTYLRRTPFSRLTPREQRALALIEWLNEDSTRWFAFFCTPDRRMRAREGEAGEWWLREPKEGEKRDKRALDDWERETMLKEDWRGKVE